MTTEEKALTTNTSAPPAASPFGATASGFELAQRQAQALAQSDIVPQAYKGKLANCLVALEVAYRSKTSPLTVMQNLNIIHGKPSWSSQYIIAAINTCGRFDHLQFKMSDDRQECFAFARDRTADTLTRGPAVSIQMAKAEGWFQKSGSKWQTMPELMLQYRAATFFGRLFCPEVLQGMQSQDEVRDVGPTDSTSEAVAARQKRIAERVKE